MGKQKLTRSEMLDRFHDYFGRAITFTILSALPACLGIPIVITSNVVTVSMAWQVVGWIFIAIAIGCIVASIGFSMRSSYWAKKSYEPPPWLVRVKAKWRETHKL